MPSKQTVKKAKKKLREGKSPKTAAGEFVHEEIEHVRRGKHGARSPRQAIAIGLSEARRSGIPVAPPRGERQRGEQEESEARSKKGPVVAREEDFEHAKQGAIAGDETRTQEHRQQGCALAPHQNRRQKPQEHVAPQSCLSRHASKRSSPSTPRDASSAMSAPRWRQLSA